MREKITSKAWQELQIHGINGLNIESLASKCNASIIEFKKICPNITAVILLLWEDLLLKTEQLPYSQNQEPPQNNHTSKDILFETIMNMADYLNGKQGAVRNLIEGVMVPSCINGLIDVKIDQSILYPQLYKWAERTLNNAGLLDQKSLIKVIPVKIIKVNGFLLLTLYLFWNWSQEEQSNEDYGENFMIEVDKKLSAYLSLSPHKIFT